MRYSNGSVFPDELEGCIFISVVRCPSLRAAFHVHAEGEALDIAEECGRGPNATTGDGEEAISFETKKWG
jgi:hypothetical protein